MKPLKIEIDDHGLFCLHNMPCPVKGSEYHAVYSGGIFEPSWEAQREGWKLVRANTRFQRFLLSRFFGQRFNTPIFTKSEGNNYE